jgi:hypothetical protein
VSALVVLALAWAAQGRHRKPLSLLPHTALLSASAGLAVWAAMRVDRSIDASRRAHPAAGTGSSAELPWSFTAMLESVAAAVAVAITFYGIRWWCRRNEPPLRVVIHGPPPGTAREVRRPWPGEIWLAKIPKREDEDDWLRHYCVIVANHASYAEVMQITTQDKTSRWWDHIPFPNDGWDHTGRKHWLEVALPPRRVPYSDFLTTIPQGDCPKEPWDTITQILSRADERQRAAENRTGRPSGGSRKPKGAGGNRKEQGAGGNRKQQRTGGTHKAHQPPRPSQGSGRNGKRA